MDISRIGEIPRKINSRLELSELLNVIMDTAKELLRAEGASLLLHDKNSDELIFNVVIGEKGRIIEGERIPRGRGIAGTVAQSGEAVIVDNVQEDPRFYREIDRMSSFETRNILCLPMSVAGDLIGVLEVVNTMDREGFNHEDLEVAEYLADQAAIAIDNRRLQDELNNRIHELTTLYHVSQALSLTRRDSMDIFTGVLEAVRNLMRVERASLFFVNEGGKDLTCVACEGLPDDLQGASVPVEKSIVGHVLTTADPLMVVDIARDIPPALMVNSGKYLTGSFIAVPIIVNNRPIGVLNVSDKKSGNSFDSFDLRVLSTIATQVGDAYMNQKNYQESRSRERLDEEIHIAAELQKKIIPEIPATYAGHHLASCYIPAKMVGGDFYDFFIFDDTKYGILVADVSGKGIPAAMFMGLARNIVRSESRIYSSPAQLLRQSNRYIWEDSEHGMFVTLFYAMVDAHNGLITYGSAGHNNQYLLRSGEDTVEKLKASGKPLGIDTDFAFEEKIVLFKPGDRLVLCSDGVIESHDPTVHLDRNEETFLDELVRLRDLSPSEMIDAIQGSRDFDEYGEHHDDFTLLIIGF